MHRPLGTVRRAGAAIVSLAAACVFLTTVAHAQIPAPKLQAVSPAGGKVGTTVDVTPVGADLEGLDTLWFDHPGITAKADKGGVFKVGVAANVPPGRYEIRASSPWGLSNPRVFMVGERDEVAEKEPNNVASAASPVAINQTVNGRVDATDVDFFKFEGKKGQRLLIEVATASIDSRLDPNVRLIDPKGVEVAIGRADEAVDLIVDATLPMDGAYTLRLHDGVYGGSPEHAYRLTIHDGPRIDAIVPAVGVAGKPNTFTLIGRNLGGKPLPGATIKGRPLEALEITATLPAALSAANLPLASMNTAALRRGFSVNHKTAKGTSNAVFVAEATDPIVVDREPNDENAKAQKVTLPCDISGTFGTAGDLDIYRFAAKKGQIWVIEATGAQVGSQADPMFTLQRLNEKGETSDIANGDDTDDPGLPPIPALNSGDVYLRWEAPADGEYQVAIQDLFSSQRGDPTLGYRLQIRPERADFALYVHPDKLDVLQGLSVGAGGRIPVTIDVWRKDGFKAPIRVEAKDLPPGCRFEPVLIKANIKTAVGVLEVDEAVKPQRIDLKLIGQARAKDTSDSYDFLPLVGDVDGTITREAEAIALAFPAPTNLWRATKSNYAAIRTAQPLTVTASTSTRFVTQGHTLPVDLRVTRRGDFKEAVAIAGAAPPFLPAAIAATIPKEATTGRVQLYVPKTVLPGFQTFVLNAAGPVPFSKDPAAKTKPNINLAETTNVVIVYVRRAPVELTIDAKGGSLKQGAALDIVVNLNRKYRFDGEVQLSLFAPDGAKLSSPGGRAGALDKSATLKIQAAADSPEGAKADVYVRATAVVNGEAIEVEEPVTLTVVKK